jgi:scyllo-inositol 2-dehydrogenase (NADP+)
LRIVVVGLGVQGVKRQRIAGADCVATVDPVNPAAQFKTIQEIPVSSYDAVLLCTPDEPKYNLIRYALTNKKHVLVEKPMWTADPAQLEELAHLAKANKVVCYTAYNHRFEPHFVRMKQLLDSKVLGEIYHCRMFYGNGTARLVRDSAWRDTGAGVLPDLGSHLLDTLHFWFGNKIKQHNFAIVSKKCFENKSPDHVVFADFSSKLSIEAEMTLLSWRNHFTCDIFAEKGSAHISSLCKWGPSTFTYRERILPSGRPVEEEHTLVQSDPTWELEYTHFTQLCAQTEPNTDFSVDQWIYAELERLSSEELLLA